MFCHCVEHANHYCTRKHYIIMLIKYQQLMRRQPRGGSLRTRVAARRALRRVAPHQRKGEVLLRGVLTLRFVSHAQPARLWKAVFADNLLMV